MRRKGVRPPYPRSQAALQELTRRLETFRHRPLVEAEAPAPRQPIRQRSPFREGMSLLDEPIPKVERLSEPLTPSPVPPPRRRRQQHKLNQRTVLNEVYHEFGGIQTSPKVGGVRRRDLLPLLAARGSLTDPPQFTLVAKVGILTDYRAVLPFFHPLERDHKIFLEGMTPNTYNFIQEHLRDDGPLKYYLVSTVLFIRITKDNGVEYMTFSFHS
jgi:hypothetical protein